MEVLPSAFVCFTLISLCFAAENQTTDLEKQTSIQKREKQCIIEDGDEGPEQKRDERQTNLPKTNSIDALSKVSPKIRLQPKTPILKPNVIRPKQQKIPQKIPLYIKTPKVTPIPATRLPVLPIERNKSISPNETDKMKEVQTSEDIKIKIENKKKPEEEEEPDSESKTSSNKDDEIKKGPQKEIPINRAGKDIENYKKESKPDTVIEENVNKETHENHEKVKPKSRFFVDKADSVPPGRKKLFEDPDRIDVSSRRTIIKEVDNEKLEPVVHVTNGTHLISIKKLTEGDKRRMSKVLTREEQACRSGNPPDLCQRIINDNPTPTEQTNTTPRPLTKDEKFILKEIFGDAKDPRNEPNKLINKSDRDTEVNNIDIKEKKVPNDSITIINHDYEEYEERPTAPPPIITSMSSFNEERPDSWNYYQPTQNIYYNPYYKNILDQYKRCYEGQQNDMNNYYTQNYNQPSYTQSPDCNSYYTYNNNNQFDDINDCKPGEVISEPYKIPEPTYDNNLARIWRTWKDIEIRFKKGDEDRLPFGVRKNNCLDIFNNEEINAKLPIPYVTQPYSNQNGAVIYRYSR